jgi:hypothetical protein
MVRSLQDIIDWVAKHPGSVVMVYHDEDHCVNLLIKTPGKDGKSHSIRKCIIIKEVMIRRPTLEMEMGTAFEQVEKSAEGSKS